MSVYNWRNGVRFERLTEESALLARGQVDSERAMNLSDHEPADGDVRMYIGPRDDQGFIIPAAEWGSIVASVSALGETTDSYFKALHLHDGGAPYVWWMQGRRYESEKPEMPEWEILLADRAIDYQLYDLDTNERLTGTQIDIRTRERHFIALPPVAMGG